MMEQQLKERLVGATVLVVIAIIVIPMVLDGPNDSSVRQQLDLPSGERSARRTVSIPLDDESSRPEARQQETDRPSRSSEPVADEPVTEPRLAETTAAVPDDDEPESSAADTAAPSQPQSQSRESASSEPVPEASRTQPWTVQVGSFGNQANADRLVERLEDMGYGDAYVSRYDDGATVHYRVRVGGYADRDTAVAKAAEISSKSGLSARQAQTTPNGG
jgi:DedD protein